jgi:preprotein translocase subunit YajC
MLILPAFISPAYAQGGAPTLDMFGPGSPIWMMVILLGIIYFFMVRPQQKRAKQHQEMVKNVRKGDTVITTGGLVGRVTRVVDDDQIEVEIADGVRVRQMRSLVSDVRAKGEPVKDDANAG